MNLFKAARCDTNELTVSAVFPRGARTGFVMREQTPGDPAALVLCISPPLWSIYMYMFLIPF